MQFLKLISCSFQITNFISNVISFLCLVSFRLGFARYSHERNHDIQDDESWKVRWRFLWGYFFAQNKAHYNSVVTCCKAGSIGQSMLYAAARPLRIHKMMWKCEDMIYNIHLPFPKPT